MFFSEISESNRMQQLEKKESKAKKSLIACNKYKKMEIWQNFYLKLKYFGNFCCHYQAKIIFKKETDKIIIRCIKFPIP